MHVVWACGLKTAGYLLECHWSWKFLSNGKTTSHKAFTPVQLLKNVDDDSNMYWVKGITVTSGISNPAQ